MKHGLNFLKNEPKFFINKITNLDINQIVELFNFEVQKSGDYSDEEKIASISKRDYSYYKEKLNDDKWIILCAKQGNKVIGFLEVSVESDYNNKFFAHSRWMIIHSDFKRKGVGQKLKKELEKRLLSNEIDYIEVHVKVTNLVSIHVNKILLYQEIDNNNGIITFRKFLSQ